MPICVASSQTQAHHAGAMHSKARSAVATVVSVLKAAGFSAQIPMGRAKRPGFAARFISGVPRPGVYIFDYCVPGDFAKLCEALKLTGYSLEDASGGQNFLQYGAARVRKIAEPA